MKIHLYTTLEEIAVYRKGMTCAGWTKDSPKRPKDAFVHIEVSERDVVDATISGVFYVRGKDS